MRWLPDPGAFDGHGLTAVLRAAGPVSFRKHVKVAELREIALGLVIHRQSRLVANHLHACVAEGRPAVRDHGEALDAGETGTFKILSRNVERPRFLVQDDKGLLQT